MKAAVLTNPGELRVQEYEKPRAGTGEIVIKIRAAAICGTDIRMWKNGINQGHILGHEVAGEVSEIGEGVTTYAVGDRVAVAPNIGCGICDACVSGKTHLCKDYYAFGIQINGAFAEYMRIPADAVRQGNVYKLNASVSFEQSSVVEPFSCVYNAFEGYRVNPGDAVLIIGAGPIGYMHAVLAKMAGAGLVVLNDLSQERLDYCQKLLPGLQTYCGNDLKGYIMNQTDGKGLDVCVTACPSPKAQASSFDLMGMFGRICFFGGLPGDGNLVPLNTNQIHYKHLVVTGSSRSSVSQYRKCMRLLEKGVVNLDNIVTNRFSLDEIQEAFTFSANANGLKSVIEFD